MAKFVLTVTKYDDADDAQYETAQRLPDQDVIVVYRDFAALDHVGLEYREDEVALFPVE